MGLTSKKISAFLGGFFYVLLGCAPVWADDTEIYFGNVGGGGATANVLFILDTSGSMTTQDKDPATGKKKTTSRMDDLKTAFNTIINGVSNVNVGLMRFSNPGGPVIYPISNVGAEVTNASGLVTASIATGNDDGYQFNTQGTVVLDRLELEMGTQAPANVTIKTVSTTVASATDDGWTRVDNSTTTLSNCSGTANSATKNNCNYLYIPTNQDNGSQQGVVGLRFTGLTIPQGAVIVRAYLELQAGPVKQVDTGTMQIAIVGEATDKNTFDTNTNSPGKRLNAQSNLVPQSGGLAPVMWSIASPDLPSTDDVIRTTDVGSIVQAMVNSSSWSPTAGKATFLFYNAASSTSKNWIGFSSYDRDQVQPRLVIEYYPSSPAPTPSAVTTALRFTNLMVPTGVTITSATLSFNAAQSNSSSTDLVIYAEKAGNSAALEATASNISGRTKTAASKVWSGVPPWVAGNRYVTPNFAAVVQEVVNNKGDGGWCGGNAMTFLITGSAGQRLAEAYEDGTQLAPRLTIQYNPATVPKGESCINRSTTSQILANSDDAEQYGTSTLLLNDPTLELVGAKPGTSNVVQKVGFRFSNVQIPKSQKITSAYLQFTAAGDDSTSVALTLAAETASNPSTFSAANLISARTLSSTVAWSPASWSSGKSYQSPDIARLVQAQVNREDWKSGNSMVFVVEGSSNTNKRRATSYDSSPGKAAKLIINYQDNGTTGIPARELIKNTVNDLNANGNTPLQDIMYEAALYFAGSNVVYGSRRGGPHPLISSTLNESGPFKYTRVSTAGAMVPGSFSVLRSNTCTEDDPNSSDCASEQITPAQLPGAGATYSGGARYQSPIAVSCQPNHLVLLTDGEANSPHSEALIKSLTGAASCSDGTSSQACVSELAKWLYDNDLAPGLPGKQNVITSTIAFYLNEEGPKNFLRSVATAGGGKDYVATDAKALSDAFNEIFVSVQQTNTSFVSAGTAVNAFNRTVNRDELYFSVFQPQSTPAWPGNMKKYKLADPPSIDIVDANGVNAVDNNGFFAENSRSFWSADTDGPNVTVGGAGALITNYATRKVYTYLDDIGSPDKNLTAAVNKLASDNTSLTTAHMGGSLPTGTSLANLIDWTRGKDVKGVDTSATRYVFADPLHSRPVAVTYGGNETDPDITVFVSTNSGFLHAIDNDDGREVFSFIPRELLPLQKLLFDNDNVTPHPSGLDGSIVTWVIDPDNDGVVLDKDGNVQEGNAVYLYVGMRRGGRNFYALDVTDRAHPKILWTIKGGVTTGFNNLGETWSQPLRANVKVGNSLHKALIFSGGYSANQENSLKRDTAATDAMGNAMYIVDAIDGTLLWSGSNATGSTTVFEDMKYSIPSSVTGADINGDGLMDVLFVGDTGGQVWRFDIHNGEDASELVTGGVIADINGAATETATPANNRRFYHAPAMFIGVNGKNPYLGIVIGSGWRGHPLNTATTDRFYMIRQYEVFSTTNTYTKLTEGDLYDATDNVIGEGEEEAQTNAKSALATAQGWYITLTNQGEKVLSTPLVVEGQLFFNSYQPGSSAAANSCQPATGINRSYVMNAFDATPINDVNGVLGLQASDRSQVINAVGIIDQQRQLIRKGADGQLISVGLEGTATKNLPSEFFKKVHRVYWYENR